VRLLDISFKKPELNLALDEVILDSAESGRTGETLRFWESPAPFVVLGVAQALRRHVWEKHCNEDHVAVLRRASAGGCVLQGPGCLNYALVLAHDLHPEIQTIRDSYCFILGAVCQALQQRGVRAHHKGVSDLAVSGRKVSGSAQKRRKRYILHHGTLLYRVPIDKMERYLREPDDRPQYRGARTHRGFVQALPLTPRELRAAVCEAFHVETEPVAPHSREIEAAKVLADEKYAALDWIRGR
jgi:lipoate-protein ligase A